MLLKSLRTRFGAVALSLLGLAMTGLLAPEIFAQTRLAPTDRSPVTPSALMAVSPTDGWQRGCPARVATTVFTGSAVQYVAIVNRANQPIVGVTLGILATDLSSRQPIGVIGAVDVDLDVASRSFASIKSPVLETQVAAKYAVSRGVGMCGLTIGIVHAQLADGTVYDYRFNQSQRFDVEDIDDGGLLESLQDAIDADVESFSRETASSGSARPESAMASGSTPKPTCVQYEDSNTKCKYVSVNGEDGCQSDTCSRYGISCSHEKCVMAIVVQPNTPPHTTPGSGS